jgi:hypothetical protein
LDLRRCSFKRRIDMMAVGNLLGGIYLEDIRMRGKTMVALIFASLPLVMVGTALGGEGIQVKITNDGTQDIVVTVYDMNAQPRKIILQNARINGFTSVPISVIGDASGRANLSWTATSTDAASPKCGHDDTSGVANDAAVNVHADSSCSV